MVERSWRLTTTYKMIPTTPRSRTSEPACITATPRRSAASASRDCTTPLRWRAMVNTPFAGNISQVGSCSSHLAPRAVASIVQSGNALCCRKIAERFENTEVGLENVYDQHLGCMEEAPTVYEEIIRGEFLMRFSAGMKHGANEYERLDLMPLAQLNHRMAIIAACSHLELTGRLEGDITELTEMQD